jgi:hypothetical protein
MRQILRIGANQNLGFIVFYLTQAEGLITGTMVKMFTIAGPVIVSGAAASAVYGPVPVLPGYGG